MNQNNDQEMRRHRETVIVGIISTATLLLIGMFGLVEIVGNVKVDDNASTATKNITKLIDGAVATFSAFVVFMYYAVVTEGTGAIRNATLKDAQHRNPRAQFLVVIRLFHFMVFLIVVVAGFAIAKRTIVG